MTLPSLPSVFPTTRNNALKNYNLDGPCLDCTMSTPACSEPLCSPFGSLTTQCTDQCVVIACNDPDHADCENQGQCNDVADCTDCVGFEDFLQCCESYAFPQSQRALDAHPIPQAFSWDASFNDVWCNDCTTKSSVFEPNLSQHAAAQGTFQAGLQQRIYPLPHRENHFQINSYSDVVSDARPSFSCMWGSCHASFSSLSELIGHVNLNHLVTSSSSTFQNSLVSPQDPQFQQLKPHAICKWADCTTQPISSFDDADLLAYHLLHEHLGVTSPSASPLVKASPVMESIASQSLSFDTTIGQDATQRQQTHMGVTSTRSTSPVRDDDLHSCNGVHECKWKKCARSFPTCAELTAHITATHIGSGQAQYECFWDHCSRNGTNGFQSKQKICRHVQSHTGHRPFQCTICQQYFSESATLQQHIRRHTQEKPYACDHPGCGKSFAITGALTIHKRTHNGIKPFKCPYCERGFAESSNLSKHLRTHTGARPYVCPEANCGKAFARPDQLNRHKSIHKKHHRGVGSG